MANAAERLFDSVLANLNPSSDLEWPNVPRDPSDIDQLDEPPDTSEEELRTVDEEDIASLSSPSSSMGSDKEKIACKQIASWTQFQTLAK